MMKFLEKFVFFRFDRKTEKDDFSEFFLRAKSKEKKQFFKKVIRNANIEQKVFLDKYHESHHVK